MRAPRMKDELARNGKCFKPLGVGDGARTVDSSEPAAPCDGTFQTPRSGGRCAHRAGKRQVVARSRKFQTPRSGGRCAHRTARGGSISRTAFQTPRSGGRCAHQAERNDEQLLTDWFQTPRSGGRCAHLPRSMRQIPAEVGFKPLGVGDGARTEGIEASPFRTIDVSNPSEWGTVRAPCQATPKLTTPSDSKTDPSVLAF